MIAEGQSKRSLMKRRKRIGERTDPCGTPLDTPKVADVALSTTTDIQRSDKKLEIRLQRGGGKP